MDRGDMPAMGGVSIKVPSHLGNYNDTVISKGLTKREMFAMSMMQRLISTESMDCPSLWNPIDYANKAIKLADELLKQLDNTEDRR